VEESGLVRVMGAGLEPAAGMHKGMVNDVAEATEAILASRQKAERTSGYEIGRAFISIAGGHVSSVNSRGVAGINAKRGVNADDVERAMDSAQAIAIPHNREVLHVVPRTYTLDGQEGVRSPLGMHGFRLEVEAHIITAASSSVQNLEKCVAGAGVGVDRFVLNPLASAEAVLSETERQMGVVVLDSGGGTTDIAIFIEGTVWHTAVISVGGNHITNDIAHGLRLPFDQAEEIKLEVGHSHPADVGADDVFEVQPFGEDQPIYYRRADLAEIIEARTEELFGLVLQEIKRSGFDGLLPAGVVLTGGTAALPGIRKTASQSMNMSARVARPEGLVGLVDALDGPEFSTSVGLLRFALRTDILGGPRDRTNGFNLGRALGGLFGRFLPE
jgi:cell division protein FtsA